MNVGPLKKRESKIHGNSLPKVKVTQLCSTLCNPRDYIVHGILQARILEWVAFPGDLPNPGIKLGSLALQADSLPTELSGKPIYPPNWSNLKNEENKKTVSNCGI